MHIDDDTPEPGRFPDVYPRDPPVNLLREPHELAPDNFFAFEGVDGTGKSLLARIIAERCTAEGRRAELLRLGRAELVGHALERAKWLNADPITLNLLNWVTVFQNTIAHRQALGDRSRLLFADRYTMTIKVRGALEGLDTDYMELLEAKVPRPRRVFLIDAPPELCLARIRAGRSAITYFEAGHRDVDAVGEPMRESSPAVRSSSAGREAELLAHLRRSREIYLRLAERQSNVIVIDNDGDPELALAIIRAELATASVGAR
jgi:thymidylate kinase